MTLEEYFAQENQSTGVTLEDALMADPDPYEAMGALVSADIQDYAQEYAAQPRSWAGANIAQPAVAAVRSMLSTATAPFNPEYSRQLTAQNMAEAQGVAQSHPGLGAELTRGVVGSIASSVPLAVLSGPAAPIALPAGHGLMRTNEAYMEARVEGLAPDKAMKYAMAQGTIEAGLTYLAPQVLKRIPYLNKLLGDRVGGLEDDLVKTFTQQVTQGSKGAVKQIAQRGLAETPEELAIQAASAVTDYLMGVNPERYLNDDGSLNIEKMFSDGGKTAAVAILSGGAVEAGGQATIAARNKFSGASGQKTPSTLPQDTQSPAPEGYQPTDAAEAPTGQPSAPSEQVAVQPSIGPTLGPEYVQTGPNTFDYRPDAQPRPATIDEIAEGQVEQEAEPAGSVEDLLVGQIDPDRVSFAEGLAKRYGAPLAPAKGAADPYEANAILGNMLERAAIKSRDTDELAQILSASKGLIDESRIAYAVASNPSVNADTFEAAKANEALRRMMTQANIDAMRRKGQEAELSEDAEQLPAEPVSDPYTLPAAPVAEQVTEQPTPDLPAPVMASLVNAKSSSRQDFIDAIGKTAYDEHFGGGGKKKGGKLDNKAAREAILAKARAMAPAPVEADDTPFWKKSQEEQAKAVANDYWSKEPTDEELMTATAIHYTTPGGAKGIQKAGGLRPQKPQASYYDGGEGVGPKGSAYFEIPGSLGRAISDPNRDATWRDDIFASTRQTHEVDVSPNLKRPFIIRSDEDFSRLLREAGRTEEQIADTKKNATSSRTKITEKEWGSLKARGYDGVIVSVPPAKLDSNPTVAQVLTENQVIAFYPERATVLGVRRATNAVMPDVTGTGWTVETNEGVTQLIADDGMTTRNFDTPQEAAQYAKANPFVEEGEGEQGAKEPWEMTREEFEEKRPPVEGYLYHGSPDGDIESADPQYYTAPWREGVGFYVTDSRDMSAEYAKGRTRKGQEKASAQTQGRINYIEVDPDAKLIDMDAPADKAVWDEVANALGVDYDASDPGRPFAANTNGAAYQSIAITYSQENQLSADETVTFIREVLEDMKYDGTTHIEGRKGTPHRVRVLFGTDMVDKDGNLTSTAKFRVVKPSEVYEKAVERAKAAGKLDPKPSPIDDRATALLPEVNDDPARAVPLPDMTGRGEKPPASVGVQKRVEALKKTDKEYRAAKKALDIAQKSSGMSDAIRANPPQVSGPLVIEPKVTFTTPTGESVTGQGYALPGLEKFKVVLVPPSGNKAKGTKRGWSVYLGGQLVESNNLGAGDTAEAALNGASRKLRDAERRGLLKAIGKGSSAAEISAAQDRLDAATERLMEKAQGQMEAPANAADEPPFVGPARPAPARPTAADADKQAIRQAYQNAKDDAIGRAWISDIRKQLPDMPKETFDKTVLAMQQDGELVINTNQNPKETRARHTPGDEINVLGEKRDVMYLTPNQAKKAQATAKEPWEAIGLPPVLEDWQIPHRNSGQSRYSGHSIQSIAIASQNKELDDARRKRIADLDAVRDKAFDDLNSLDLRKLKKLAQEEGAVPVPHLVGKHAYVRGIYHRRVVKQALASGKPVPTEVLADYPDLQKKANPLAATQKKGDKKPRGGVSDGDQGIPVKFDPPSAITKPFLGPSQVRREEPVTVRRTPENPKPVAPYSRVLFAEEAKGAKPISGPEVIAKMQQVLDLLSGTVTKIGGYPFRQAGYAAVYRSRQNVIRKGRANDIDRMAHEMAHAIEPALTGASKNPWTTERIGQPAAQELIALGRALYGDTIPNAGYGSEGFAEFMYYWITQPSVARESAPIFHQYFVQNILSNDAKLKKMLEAAQDAAVRWEAQGVVNRVDQIVYDPGAIKERVKRARSAIKSWRESWVKRWWNAGDPLYAFSEQAQKSLGRVLKEEDNPYQVFVAYNQQAASMATEFAENGVRDPNDATKRITRGLKEAGKILKENGIDHRTFSVYLVSRRAKASYDDVRGEMDPGMSRQDAEMRTAQIEYEHPEIVRAAEVVYEWSDGILQYWASASERNRLAYEAIKLGDPGYYVALGREFDAYVEEAASYVSSGGPKRRYGSGRRVKEPLPVMIANAQQLIEAAHKEYLKQAVVGLGEVPNMGQWIEPVAAPMQHAATIDALEAFKRSLRELAKSNTAAAKRARQILKDPTVVDAMASAAIPIMTVKTNPDFDSPYLAQIVNGEVQWYRVSPDLMQVAQGMEFKKVNAWLRAAQGLAGLARTTKTTLNAGFQLLGNPPRDFVTMLANIQTDPIEAGKLYKKALWDLMVWRATGKRSAALDLYIGMGGEMMTSLAIDGAHTRRVARKLSGRKGLIEAAIDKDVGGALNAVITMPGQMYDAYRDIIGTPEMAARLAGMSAVAAKRGLDLSGPISKSDRIALTVVAKELTTDFTGGGSTAKEFNRYIPFLNASIQGIRSTAIAAQRNPIKWGLTHVAAQTLPAILAFLAFKDEEWYQEMDPKEMFMYHKFKLPWSNTLLRIPRPFETGGIFAAMPEMILMALYKQDPDYAVEWAHSLFDVLAPPVLPTAIGIPLEQVYGEGGRNFFFDQPIVAPSLQNLPVEEQYNEYTTKAARSIGKTMGLSPARIDHVINSLFGSIGRDTLTVVGLGPTLSERELELADLPVLGRLFKRGGAWGGSHRSVSKMYDALGDHRTRQNSIDNPETPQERNARLMLEDAATAVGSLSIVIRDTYKTEDREEYAKLRLSIAQDALQKLESGGFGPKYLQDTANVWSKRKEAIQDRKEQERRQ